MCSTAKFILNHLVGLRDRGYLNLVRERERGRTLRYQHDILNTCHYSARCSSEIERLVHVEHVMGNSLPGHSSREDVSRTGRSKTRTLIDSSKAGRPGTTTRTAALEATYSIDVLVDNQTEFDTTHYINEAKDHTDVMF